VDFIVLAANTPHIIYDELKKKVLLPIISIVEETANYAKKQGLKRMGLLGTEFTMNGDFFRKPFVSKGIELVIPNNEEIEFVSDRISCELELGLVTKATESRFCEIIQRMKDEEKVEAVVLGCTELPLILSNKNSQVICVDSMQIHIQSIIDNILE